MSSLSETGHARNVANFEDLISLCVTYGSAYNPSNAAIKITALQTKLAACKTAIQNVQAAKSVHDVATNTREISFQNLKKLSTRIVHSLESTTASPQSIKDVRTINRKLQGTRAGKLTKADAGKVMPPLPDTGTGNNTEIETPPLTGPRPVNISVSRQSFDSLVDNFSQLLQILAVEPLYAPNEADLKLASLNTLLTTFKTNNTAVFNTDAPYSTARVNRDLVLYAPSTGIIDLVAEVKKYVSSLFGVTSLQYKQIRGIAFKTVKI